jgi:hypothetical protein
VGATVAETDLEKARVYLRESLELSTALGYQGALGVRAAGLAFLANDRTANLVRFPLSKQGEWINGQLLYSNGGYPKGRLPV